MKKLFVTAIVALALAAWVAPAKAVDFSGELWIKGEFRDSANFTEDRSGDNPCDDYDTDDRTISSVVEQRTRLTATAKPTDDTTVKITIQDTRAWGDYKSADCITANGPQLTDAGSNHLDLHEAFIQINNFFGTPVNMKIGRQELAYGDQRLIGAFDWSANARSFDAVKFTYGSDAVDVDAFAAKIRESNASATVAPNGSPSATDEDQNFYGVYATIKSLPQDNKLDLYLLLLRDGSGSTPLTMNNTGCCDISGIEGSQNLWTYGARLNGKFQAIDYTLEVPFQTGSIDTSGENYDIDAYAIAAKVGYTLPTAQKIRVGLEYDFASGDSDSSDSDIETFSNLYPTNHGHYGFMDRIGWRNMEAWSVNVTAQATDQLSLYAAYHIFKLAEEEDGWYLAGDWMDEANSGYTGDSSNNEDNIGSEIDFMATYKYNKAVTLQAGISRFFTGDLIEDGISHEEDQTWGYAKITAKF